MFSFTSILIFVSLVYLTQAGPVSGSRQVCECDTLEVTSSGGARDHVPSYLGNSDKKFFGTTPNFMIDNVNFVTISDTQEYLSKWEH